MSFAPAVTRKLGIANARVYDQAEFAQTVLRLPLGSPVYQQMLIHVTGPYPQIHGPRASAEWDCADPDNEAGDISTLRQISAHDTHYSRRNLKDSSPYKYYSHSRDDYYNQNYYVGNEPEIGCKETSSTTSWCTCWDPPSGRWIDSHLAYVFTNPTTSFWRDAPAGQIDSTCVNNQSTFRGIKSDALAYVYLFLKREAEGLGRGHIVLPPATSNAGLGDNTFEANFFNYIHGPLGVTINGQYHQDPITPDQMRALHLHHYAGVPSGETPLANVAYTAGLIRSGASWYRVNFNSGASLNLDLMLSETGMHHSLDNLPISWGGGWLNFREGLSWWNSYLCWLTRYAQTDCNLSAGHDVYACIQTPESRPYAYSGTTGAGTRNQNYLSVDNMNVQTLYNQSQITCAALTDNEQASDPEGNPYPGVHSYRNSFLAYNNAIYWHQKTWKTTPFGASFTTWANIGADAVTGNLTTGWVDVPANSTGDVALAGVSLPRGFSTVFFTVIKDAGTFEKNQLNQVQFRWIKPGGSVLVHGYMALNEFEDSDDSASPTTYSAMHYPVVCYSTTDIQLSVVLTKNLAGPKILLGRPIVLSGICSWFMEQ